MTVTSSDEAELAHGTVIHYIERAGDVGELGYSAYGQKLPKCSSSGSKDYWSGSTRGSLDMILPICYVTEKAYTLLTDAEIESVSSLVLGIVPDDYSYMYHRRSDHYNSICWGFKPDVTARPLPGTVVTPPPSAEGVPPDEDDEGIFGDINKKWIIIGIIAAVILGMLS